MLLDSAFLVTERVQMGSHSKLHLTFLSPKTLRDILFMFKLIFYAYVYMSVWHVCEGQSTTIRNPGLKPRSLDLHMSFYITEPPHRLLHFKSMSNKSKYLTKLPYFQPLSTTSTSVICTE